jgi:ABC-2 type transport system ATP-binding protein
METTGTAYMRDKFVESLSHGMQQRVGIARTLLHDPQVLILDEPANGLDPQARIEMRDLLIRLAKLGKSLIVTSHILPELSRICDRIAILTHGRLRAVGTVEEIGRQVSQQRTIEAQLASAGQLPAAAEVIRRAIEAEADIVQVPAEASVRFRTACTEEQLGDLLAMLVRGGIRVTQFREVQTDLEEAFMSFARPGASDSMAARSETAVVAGGAAHG